MSLQPPPTPERARALLADVAARARPPCLPVARQPLWLYGAGNLGRMARDYLRRVGVPLAGVVDADAAAVRRQPFWHDITVHAPDEVPAQVRDTAQLAVCVATAPWLAVSGPLRAAGWREVVPFYDLCEQFRDRHPLGNGWHSGVLDSDDRIHLGSVLERWHDDASRAHHLAFVAWRALREEWPLPAGAVDTGNRFFIPEVMQVLHDREVFLDVGAHQGEVSVALARRHSRGLAAVHLVEPDADSRAVLQAQVALERRRAPQTDWVVHDCATYSLGGAVPFAGGLGYPSQFGEPSPAAVAPTVRARTLDELDIDATFVKLHLEGWELDTLLGGAAWLRRRRPIVAATAYHNRDGLWRLPQAMMALLPGYRFLFRAHSWLGTGCVVYAIPQERCQRIAGEGSA